MTFASRAPRVAIAALTCMAWSGCGAAPGESNPAPEIELKRITNAAQTLTPANALLPDSSERELISLAHDTVLSQCVEKQGLTLSLAGDEYLDWVTSLTTPYGGGNTFFPLDPERMARFGYHDPRDRELSRPSVTWEGEFTPLDVVRSCDDEVTVALGGEPPFDMVRLVRDAGARAGSDPRRVGPRTAWIRCMASEGYSYTQEGAPWMEFTQQSATVATAEEVAVAVADASCQASSRTIDTLVALLVAYQEEALSDNAEEVAAYQDYLAEVLSRATRIVNEHPAPVNRRFNRERS